MGGRLVGAGGFAGLAEAGGEIGSSGEAAGDGTVDKCIAREDGAS